MSHSIKLSYLEAATKSLEIVKKDAVHFKDPEQNFPFPLQIHALMRTYQTFDLESTMKCFKAVEPNEKKLIEEVNNFMRVILVQNRNKNYHPKRQLNCKDLMHLQGFTCKYNFGVLIGDTIFLLFPLEEYNLLSSNSSLRKPLSEEMKIYKNFKSEHANIGFLSLLPSGKKYGGFVKALIHFFLENKVEIFGEGGNPFHTVLGIFRCYFNSKHYSTENRLEGFKKLNIKEEDCVLWSQEFDKVFSGYKDVH